MPSGRGSRPHQGPSFRFLQVIDHARKFPFSIVRSSEFRALRASGSRETDFTMHGRVSELTKRFPLPVCAKRRPAACCTFSRRPTPPGNACKGMCATPAVTSTAKADVKDDRVHPILGDRGSDPQSSIWSFAGVGNESPMTCGHAIGVPCAEIAYGLENVFGRVLCVTCHTFVHFPSRQSGATMVKFLLGGYGESIERLLGPR